MTATLSGESAAATVEELVQENLPIVKSVVLGLAARFPRHVDRDELVQAGLVGLLEAARRYDPATGVPFARWASIRVRGAVLDAARAADFASRSVRSAMREVDAAEQQLSNELGQMPTEAQVAERAGMSVEELDKVRSEVHQAVVLSLDMPADSDRGESASLGHTIIDHIRVDPLEELEQREEHAYLRDAIALLPERLREVIEGYFLHGETSAELAERLQVTESRVSQMRSQALALMREGIEHQYADPAKRTVPQGTAAARRAAYAAALAARSSFTARVSGVSGVPMQRVAADTRRTG